MISVDIVENINTLRPFLSLEHLLSKVIVDYSIKFTICYHLFIDWDNWTNISLRYYANNNTIQTKISSHTLHILGCKLPAGNNIGLIRNYLLRIMQSRIVIMKFTFASMLVIIFATLQTHNSKKKVNMNRWTWLLPRYFQAPFLLMQFSTTDLLPRQLHNIYKRKKIIKYFN